MSFPNEVLVEYTVNLLLPSNEDKIDTERIYKSLMSMRRETPCSLITKDSFLKMFDLLQTILKNVNVSHLLKCREHSIRREMLNLLRWMMDSNVLRSNNDSVLCSILEILLDFAEKDNEQNAIIATKIYCDYLSVFRQPILEKVMYPSISRILTQTLELLRQRLSGLKEIKRRIGFCRKLRQNHRISFDQLTTECPVHVILDEDEFMPASQCSFQCLGDLIFLVAKIIELSPKAFKFKIPNLLAILSRIVSLKAHEVVFKSEFDGKLTKGEHNVILHYSDENLIVEIMRIQQKALCLIKVLMKSIFESYESEQSTMKFVFTNTLRYIVECPKRENGTVLHSELCETMSSPDFWNLCPLAMVSSLEGLFFGDNEGVLYSGQTVFCLSNSTFPVFPILIESMEANRSNTSRLDLIGALRAISFLIVDWPIPLKAKTTLLKVVYFIVEEISGFLASTASPSETIENYEVSEGLPCGKQRIVFVKILEISLFVLKQLCSQANHGILKQTDYECYMDLEFEFSLEEATSMFENICKIVQTSVECLVRSSHKIAIRPNTYDMADDEICLIREIVLCMCEGILIFTDRKPYYSIGISYEMDELVKRFQVLLSEKQLFPRQSSDENQDFEAKPLDNDGAIAAICTILKLFSMQHVEIIVKHIVKAFFKRQTDELTICDHIRFHLIRELIEMESPFRKILAREIFERISKRKMNEFEFFVFLQVIRSLHRGENGQKTTIELFSHRCDQLMEALIEFTVDSGRKERLYIWIELLTIVRPTLNQKVYFQKLEKWIHRLIDLLVIHAASKHPRDLKITMLLIILLIPSALGNILIVNNRSILWAINESLKYNSIAHKGISSFCSIAQTVLNKSIDKTNLGMIGCLIQKVYSLPMLDGALPILSVLGRLSGFTRRSYRNFSFGLNVLNQDDSVEERGQKVFDRNRIVVSFNARINRLRQGRINLPAKTILSNCVRILSEEFEESVEKTAFRVIEAFCLNHFSLSKGNDEFSSDLVFALLVCVSNEKLDDEVRRKTKFMLAAIMKLGLIDGRKAFDAFLSGLKRGMKSVDRKINDGSVDCFEKMLETTSDESIIDGLSQFVISTTNSDGSWMSRKSGLECMLKIIDKQKPAKYLSAFVESCILALCALNDEIDCGLCELSVKVIDNLLMDLSYCPGLVVKTFQKLMLLIVSPIERIRLGVFGLLQKLIDCHRSLILGIEEKRYIDDLLVCSESIFDGFQSLPYCFYLEGLILLDRLDPSLMFVNPNYEQLYFDVACHVQQTIPPNSSEISEKTRIKLLLARIFKGSKVEILVSELINPNRIIRQSACSLLTELYENGSCREKAHIDAIVDLVENQHIPPEIFRLVSPQIFNVNRLVRNVQGICVNLIEKLIEYLQSPRESSSKPESLIRPFIRYMNILYNLGHCKNCVAEILNRLQHCLVLTQLFPEIHESLLGLCCRFPEQIIPILATYETISDPNCLEFIFDLVRSSAELRKHLSSNPSAILDIMSLHSLGEDGITDKLQGSKVAISLSYEIAQFEPHNSWFIQHDELVKKFRNLWVVAKPPDGDFPENRISSANLNSQLHHCWIVIKIMRQWPDDFELLWSLTSVCFNPKNYLVCEHLLKKFFRQQLPDFPVEWKRKLFEAVIERKYDLNWLNWLKSAVACALGPCVLSSLKNANHIEQLLGRPDHNSLIAKFTQNVIGILNGVNITKSNEFHRCRPHCLRFIAELLAYTPKLYFSDETIDEIEFFVITRLNPELYDPCDVFESRIVLLRICGLFPTEKRLENAMKIYASSCKDFNHTITASVEPLDVFVKQIFPLIPATKIDVETVITDILSRGLYSSQAKCRLLQHLTQYSAEYSKFKHWITCSIILASVEITIGYESEFAFSIGLKSIKMILGWENEDPFMHEVAIDSLVLSSLRILIFFKSVENLDCLKYVREIKDIIAVACTIGVADNVIQNIGTHIYSSLLSPPQKCGIIQEILDLLLNLWTRFEGIPFSEIDQPVTVLLKQLSPEIIRLPKVRMFYWFVSSKLFKLHMNVLMSTKLFNLIMNELILANIAFPGALINAEDDRLEKTVQCFDLLAGQVFISGELHLLLSYFPYQNQTKSVNLLELYLNVLLQVCAKMFKNDTAQPIKDYLGRCLSVGIVSIRPYVACLQLKQRKSILYSILTPIIEKSNDQNLLLSAADTFKMWASKNEFEYGDQQFGIREKIVILSKFLKPISLDRFKNPIVLDTIFAGFEGLLDCCYSRNNEQARRIEQAILISVKQSALFERAFANLSSKTDKIAHDRLFSIFSMVEWSKIGPNSYWIGVALKLLLECATPESDFEIVCSSNSVRREFFDYDDQDISDFFTSAANLDARDLVEEVGTLVANIEHPVSRYLAHNIWIFVFEQFARKLTPSQANYLNQIYVNFIVNEQHKNHIYDRPITFMQTILEGFSPMLFDGHTNLSALSLQLSAKSYNSYYESIMMLEHVLSSIGSKIYDLPENQPIREKDDFVLNALQTITEIVDESLYMNSLMFNRAKFSENAILMESVGEYTSSYHLYAKALGDLADFAANKQTETDCIDSFECKFANSRMIECLRQLGQWKNVSSLAMESVEKELDALWRMPYHNLITINHKVSCFKEMETKRNAHFYGFYNILIGFFTNGGDFESIETYITGCLKYLKRDFLCLPNDCLTNEHFRTLNRIQRIYEIHEFVAIAKGIQTESRKRYIIPGKETKKLLERTVLQWREKRLSPADDYVEHDSIISTRKLLLNHLLSQNKIIVPYDRIIKILSEQQTVELDSTLRQCSSPIQALENFLAHKQRVADSISIEILTDCSKEVVECVRDISQYVQQSKTFVITEIEDLLSSNEQSLKLTDLFNNSWLNDFSPEKIYQLSFEHEQLEKKFDCLRPAEQCSGVITSNRARAMIDHLNFEQWQQIGNEYDKISSLNTCDTDIRFRYTNYLVNVLEEMVLNAETMPNESLNKIIEQIFLVASRVNDDFEKTQILAENLYFVFVAICSSAEKIMFLDKFQRVLVETNTNGWTPAIDFRVLIFQKLVRVLYETNANLPESEKPVLDQQSHCLLQSLLLIATQFPGRAFRYARQAETCDEYRQISSIVQNSLLFSFSPQIWPQLQFEQSFLSLRNELTIDYVLDKIADCCVHFIDKYTDNSDSVSGSDCVKYMEKRIGNKSSNSRDSEANLVLKQFLDTINRTQSADELAKFFVEQLKVIREHSLKVDNTYTPAIEPSFIIRNLSNLNIVMPGSTLSIETHQGVQFCPMVKIIKIIPETRIVLLEKGRVGRRMLFRGNDGKVYSFLVLFGKSLDSQEYTELSMKIDDILRTMPRTSRRSMRLLVKSANSYRISHDLQLIEDFTIWRESPTCPLNDVQTDFNLISLVPNRLDPRNRPLLLKNFLLRSLSLSSFFHARQQLTLQLAITNLVQYAMATRASSASEFEIMEIAKSSSHVFACQWRIPMVLNGRPQAKVPFRLTPMIRTLIALPGDSVNLSLLAGMTMAAYALTNPRSNLERFVFACVHKPGIELKFSLLKTKEVLGKLEDCKNLRGSSNQNTDSLPYKLLVNAVENVDRMPKHWLAQL